MSVIGTWILNETLNTNYTPEYPNGFGATVKATIKGSKTVTEGGEDFLLTWDLSVTFITSNALLPLGMQLTGDILANGEALISYNDDVVEIYKNGAYKSPFDILPKEITITEADNETFKYWLPLNAERVVIDKPLAEITYNGQTIAELNAGETATLSCEGKRMVSDVVVKVNEVEEKEDSPLPTEIATEDEMTALLSTAEVGSVYKFTGTSETYETDALYIVAEGE